MMVFENAKTSSGADWPNRWVSEDGMYSITRYRYWNRWGHTCGPEHACEPYFAAYRNHDGKALAGRNVKIESFEKAAGFCMADRDNPAPTLGRG